uniref:Putative transmembrane protein n=1 Tax=Toxoplasma gondii COUG TaxID=1074873 RepID=A0A2G8Y7J0_TOXGO|nr:putative transmembrane protein [Toxoplasma gondii COUG]
MPVHGSRSCMYIMQYFCIVCLLIWRIAGAASIQNGAVQDWTTFCRRCVEGSPSVAVPNSCARSPRIFSGKTRPGSFFCSFSGLPMRGGHELAALRMKLHTLAALLPDNVQSHCNTSASCWSLPSRFRGHFKTKGPFLARQNFWKHAFRDRLRPCSPLWCDHKLGKTHDVGVTQPKIPSQPRTKNTHPVPAFCFEASESATSDPNCKCRAPPAAVPRQISVVARAPPRMRPSPTKEQILPIASPIVKYGGRREGQPSVRRGDNRSVAFLRFLRNFPKRWSGGWGSQEGGTKNRDSMSCVTDEAYGEDDSFDHPLGTPCWRLTLRRRKWLGFVDSEEEELVDVHFKKDGTAIAGHGIPGMWTLTRRGVSLFLFVPRETTPSAASDQPNDELDVCRRGVQQAASPELSQTVFHLTAYLHWDAESGTPYMYRGSITRDREGWLVPSFLFRPVVATFYGYGIVGPSRSA